MDKHRNLASIKIQIKYLKNETIFQSGNKQLCENKIEYFHLRAGWGRGRRLQYFSVIQTSLSPSTIFCFVGIFFF